MFAQRQASDDIWSTDAVSYVGKLNIVQLDCRPLLQLHPYLAVMINMDPNLQEKRIEIGSPGPGQINVTSDELLDVLRSGCVQLLHTGTKFIWFCSHQEYFRAHRVEYRETTLQHQLWLL